MNSMTKIFAFTICFLSLTITHAREASTSTLTLIGRVPPMISVGFLPTQNKIFNKIVLSSEEFRTGFNNVTIGSIREISNDPKSDYQVQFVSTHGGKMVHENDPSSFSRYTISYGDLLKGAALNEPVTAKVNPVSGLRTQDLSRSLKISSAGLPKALPGSYSDTLIFTIIAM